ncbi:MAG TPA: hypothetical protein VLX92_06135, partial [Kofleriaceae bacterium]|nr:hypothetical protein [Kofleriaceae bacterium]
MSRRALSFAGVCAAACGATNHAPQLDAVVPATVSSLAATPAVVHGEQLDAAAHVGLDDDRPAELANTWQDAIDATALPDASVTWRGPTEIDIVVPAGLPLGPHDVTAIGPSGTPLVLPGGLSVVAEPVNFQLSIEDAPGGTGAPIGARALAAGDSLDAYAVVRDGGAFVMDAPATWSASLGTIAADPAGHATFTATTVGATRLTATLVAASLSASSGALAISAGAASQLAIDDAPGGSGAPIGDRGGLTTDASGGLTAYAVARDAYGNFVADTAVTWTLTGVTAALPPAPATSAALDFATPGAGVLHASSSLGTAQTGTLSVVPGRVAELAISPATLAVSADAAPVAFTATAYDGDGNVTTTTGILTWSIASGPITSIDPVTGSFTPTAAGTGAIALASSLGPSATSGAISVLPG